MLTCAFATLSQVNTRNEAVSDEIKQQLILKSCAVFAGAAVSQPGGVQSRGEVRQPDGGHPAAAAGGEAPVQPGLLGHPQ